MNRFYKIAVSIIFGIGLILIRMYESELFYDPLLAFFKTDHSTQILPEMDKTKLLLNIALRFAINTLLSLVILWVIFRNRAVLKVAGLIYVSLFILFMIAVTILLNSSEARDHMALFYVRRFLIQPLLLLILLPAFYFQKRR